MSTINTTAGNATTATALYKISDGTANLTFQTNRLGAITINANQNANFVSVGLSLIHISEPTRPY